MNLKIMERYLRVNLLGPGAVSQRLRNTALGNAKVFAKEGLCYIQVHFKTVLTVHS